MAEDKNAGQVGRAGFAAVHPDDHGQAALLLVESLLHGLVERSIITVADAIGFVETAVDVREEIGHDRHEPQEEVARTLAILRSIASSLRLDLDGEPPLKGDD